MRAHRTDPVSLTFALVFLAIAAWWLVAKLLDLTVPDAGWFVAGLLIIVGVLGLLGALRAGRASAAPATAPPAASSPAEPAAAHPATASADVATADLASGHPATATAHRPGADPAAGPENPTPLPPDLASIPATDPTARDRAGDPPA